MNIAEILKDCPKGTKLYSPLCGECKLSEIDGYTIRIFDSNVNYYYFYHDGSYVKTGECLLFPSKENRDWSKFQRPFIDGDIVFYNDTVAIFKEWGDDTLFRTHCVFYTNVSNKIYSIEIDRPLFGKYIRKHIRFATEDEKRMLFDAIKVNGYKWNEETKTLEKLIEPKFKVGDKIIKRDSIVNSWIISSVSSEYYGLKLPNGSEGIGVLSIAEQDDYELVPDIKPKFKVGDKIVKKNIGCVPVEITSVGDEFYYSNTHNGVGVLSIKDQDNWELVHDKFDINTLKPFDKVLVRTFQQEQWRADFFSHYIKKADFPYNTVSKSGYYYCIPYNDETKHLLGTTNDCDEFYKNWEL